MIAETANLATARNVVKEAARDHNGNGPDHHPIGGRDVMKVAMNRREQNKVSRRLTERLSGKPQRMTNLKLPVHGGPR